MRKAIVVIVALSLVAAGAWLYFRLEQDRTPPAGDEQSRARNDDEPDESQAIGSERPARDPLLPGRAATAARVLVKGQVIEARSRKIVAGVDVVFASERQEATATSDDEGRFEIELVPGSYTLRAVGDGVLAHSIPTLRLSSAASIEIEVHELATVRGRLRYHDGTAAAGATLELRQDQSVLEPYLKTGELFPAVAERDGSYELLAPPGSWLLRASDGTVDAFASLEKLTPGETREGFDIVLDRSCGAAGRVTLPDGKPAVGVEVVLSPRIPGTSKYDRLIVRTDGEGRFERDKLRPGRYVVEATFWGYGPSAPLAFELVRGQRNDAIRLRLNPPATLRGRVTNEDGHPLEEVEVARVWMGSKLRYEKLHTGKDGTFEFRDVGPGPHMVRARKPGYVEVSDETIMAPRSDLLLVMPAAGGMRGRVATATGPVGQFTVKAQRRGESATTEEDFLAGDGHFELFPLRPGPYTVSLEAPGFVTATVTDVEVKAGEHAPVVVELRPR